MATASPSASVKDAWRGSYLSSSTQKLTLRTAVWVWEQVCVCASGQREWAQLCCRVKGTAHGDLETVQMFLQEKRKCIKVLNKITCCQSRLTLMYCVFANAMMPGKCPRPKPWKYEVPAFSYTPNVLVCWSLTYFGENLFQSHRDPLNFTRNRSSLQHQVLGKTFRKIPDHSH